MPKRARLVSLAPIAVLFVAVAVGAPACKSSPSNVCKKFVALEVAKLTKRDPNAVTSDMRDTEEKNCLQEMEQKKKDAPNQYACEADCVNSVKDVDDLDPCLKKCPKNE